MEQRHFFLIHSRKKYNEYIGDTRPFNVKI